MTDELLRKLQELLKRRITNEKQVVYLMVELRKLMDREKYKDPVLRTFSNWVVHTDLTYPQEGSAFILKEFDHQMVELFDPQEEFESACTHFVNRIPCITSSLLQTFRPNKSVHRELGELEKVRPTL